MCLELPEVARVLIRQYFVLSQPQLNLKSSCSDYIMSWPPPHPPNPTPPMKLNVVVVQLIGHFQTTYEAQRSTGNLTNTTTKNMLAQLTKSTLFGCDIRVN